MHRGAGPRERPRPGQAGGAAPADVVFERRAAAVAERLGDEGDALQASADSPIAWCAAARSSACGGKTRSSSPPRRRPHRPDPVSRRSRSVHGPGSCQRPPRLFDRDLHRKRLDRAAPRYAAAGFLKDRAAADLVERLEAIVRDFPLAVDLGARDGAFARALAASPAQRARRRADRGRPLAARCWRVAAATRVQADEERLPFADASLDLVVSSLALHWVNDLPGALIQIRRALKPDGLFLGAVLGGETLTELREALVAGRSRRSPAARARASRR